MRFQYLGTGASEGWPAVFCNCPSCQKAYRLGGKNIRTRAQALIGQDLLLDFPQDTYAHKLKFGLDLSKVHYLFITHKHMDHFYPNDLAARGGAYAHGLVCPDLEIYCARETKETYDLVLGQDKAESIEKTLHWHMLKAFQSVEAGPYTVTPLPANHMHKGNEPFVFHIENKAEGKSVLYLHDSGYYSDPVWDYFSHLAKPADLISLDATNGDLEQYHADHHMGVPEAIRVAEKMRQIGAADENTHIVLNHFSHNGSLLYEDLTRIASPHHIDIAYDGRIYSL